MKRKLFTYLTVLCACTISQAQTILPATIPCNSTLSLSGSPYLANSSVTVPSGCLLTVEPGVEVKMGLMTDFIIHGAVKFQGTAALPIYIHPKDSTWGMIVVDHATDTCVFNYMKIESTRPTFSVNGSESPKDTGIHRAAISSYYSSVKIWNCIFKKNYQSIYVKYGTAHINKCTIDSTNLREKINLAFVPHCIVENCVLDKTYGYNLYDDIDFDAIKFGIIRNNIISRADDDGIDIGEVEEKPSSDILIQNNFIRACADKAVSIGENVKRIRVEGNTIIGSAYGIAIKDSALAFIDHNVLYKDTIGIACYQKGDGWPGGGNAFITNTLIINSIDSAFFTDAKSKAVLAYNMSDTDGPLPGSGNLYGDPLFVSAANFDFHLAAGSPAINTGHPSMLKDSDGSRTDMGIYYTSSFTAIGIADKNNSIRCLVVPNPTEDGLFNIRYEGIDQKAQFRLCDKNGRVVAEAMDLVHGVAQQVNINAYSKGLYFYQIISSEGVYTGKLLVK